MGAVPCVVVLLFADFVVWLYNVADMLLALWARVAAATPRVVAAADLSLLVISPTLPDALQRVVLLAACTFALALPIGSRPVCRAAAGPLGWSSFSLLSRLYHCDAVLHVPKVLMFGP